MINGSKKKEKEMKELSWKKKLKHKQRGGVGWELGLLIAVSKVPISIDDTRVSSKTKRRHTRRLGRPSLSAYPEELMGGP